MLYSDESTFQLVSGKMDFEFSVPKTKGTIQTFISDRSKSKRLSLYGGAAEQTAWVTGIVRRYYWHGGIYWDCTEYILPSRWCLSWEVHGLLYQDNARSHSACATTAWFRRQSECTRLASRSVSYWKMYGSSWKGESDNNNHRLLSFWSLVSSEIGQKKCTCRT